MPNLMSKVSTQLQSRMRASLVRVAVATLLGSVLVPVIGLSTPHVLSAASADAAGSFSVTSNGPRNTACGVGSNFLTVQLPDSKALSGGSSYTLEAWVKTDSASSNVANLGCAEIGISNAYASNGDPKDFWVQRQGRVSAGGSYYLKQNNNVVARCDGSDAAATCPKIEFPIGRWAHLAFQKSGTAPNIRLTVFIDGQVVVTRTGLSSSVDALKFIQLGPFGDSNSSKVFYGQSRITSGAIYPTDGTSTFRPAYDFSDTVSGGTVLALFKPASNSKPATSDNSVAGVNLTDLSGNGASIFTYLAAAQVSSSSDFASPPPPAFTYSSSSITTTAGTAITPNTTVLTGGDINSYAVSPALPNGLSLNATTGTISGTPSIYSTTTNYVVTGTQASSGIMTTASVTITVNKPPTSVTIALSNAQVQVGVVDTVTATASVAGTISFQTDLGVISGCSAVATTLVSPFTATCGWNPTSIYYTMNATLTPTLNELAVSTSTPALTNIRGSLSLTSTGTHVFPDASGSLSTNNALLLNFPANSGISANKSFTIETWVQVASTTLNMQISSWLGDSFYPDRGEGFILDSNGSRIVPFAASNFLGYRNLQTPISIATNEWKNIVFQRSVSGSQGIDSIFVNGRLIASYGTYLGGSKSVAVKIGPFVGVAKIGPTQVLADVALYSEADFSPSATYSFTSNTLALFQPSSTTCGTSTVSPSNVTASYWTSTFSCSTDFPTPPPSISSVSSNSGPAAGGNTVVISGSNFTNLTSLKFGSTTLNVSDYTINTFGNQITAKVPSGSAGTVDVAVVTAGGISAVTSTDQYTYLSAPTITALSPSSGAVGGGTQVVITGTGFTGASAVQFGTANATSFTVNSSTQITAVTPSGSGAVNVKVTSLGGVSAAFTYTYTAQTTITSISPSSGTTSGGTEIRIVGTNFIGTTSVKFGAVDATSFTVLSSTEISATSPSASAATVGISVLIGGNTVTLPSAFTYTAAVTISRISPSYGSVVGGTQVIIIGSNFTGVTDVKFGSTSAAAFTVNSSTQITATAPAGVGVLHITVTATGGTSAQVNADLFTYYALPTVTSLGTSAGTSSGGTSVVINGTNFTAVSTVAFGSNSATSVTYTSATQLTAVSPSGTGTVDVTVTTLGGTSTTVSADQFTYFARPIVSSISPNSGPETGSTSVVISGSNFTGATTVTFGSTNATRFTVDSATQITALSPSGTGSVDIKVGTPGGLSATAIFGSFSYVALPTITSISPSSGVITGGTSVTITGTNLSSLLASGGVLFGTLQAQRVTLTDPTHLQVLSPVATTLDPVHIILTNASGSSSQTSADLFTYTQGALSLTFGSSPTGVTYGEASGTHSVTATSNPANTGSMLFASTTLSVCTVNASTGALTVLSAGTCTISANDSGTTNFAAATQVTQNITIAKATPSLSAFTIPNQSFGASPFTLTAPTVSGSVPGAFTFASGTTSVATISSNTLSIVAAGTSIITATFTPTDGTNYNTAQINATVTVGQAGQVITVTSAAPTRGNLGSTYTPTATSPAGSVIIALDTSSTGCSFSGGVVTITASGNCVINFNQAGSANYGAAPLVQQTIVIYAISCSVSGSFWLSAKTIPTRAGQSCSGIATIPVGIEGVAISAFATGTGGGDVNRNVTAIVFPTTGFTSIDIGGFQNLGLTSVTIPASVTIVGMYGFQNNPLVTATITGGIGGSSTYLGDSVFGNKVYGLGPNGAGVPLQLTFGTGNIVIGDNFGSATTFGSVNFGTGITTIGANAFKQNGISNWIPEFPSTVTAISADAFTYSNIKTIRFGSATTLNLTSINSNAFDRGALTSFQDCEPTGTTTVLHSYLSAYQPQAVIWCNAIVANAPTSLAATAGTGQAELSWSAGASNNEAPTTDYSIKYSSNSGTTWTDFAHTASSTRSITVTGLTNGTTYLFKVAAVNLFGASAFSLTAQAKPMGLSFAPVFDTPISTSSGFTVNVTNYDAAYVWQSAIVIVGNGTVSIGTAANGKLPLTVTGMSPGAASTISITSSRQNYTDGVSSVSGSALKAALTPVVGNIVATTGGFTASITNFDATFQWIGTTTLGTAAISSSGAIVVSGVNPSTQVILTVSTSQSGYAPGSSTTTITTLQLLHIVYNGTRATGGSVPTDSNSYVSNASAVVLPNQAQGGLTLSGYEFAGWSLNQDESGQPLLAGSSLQLGFVDVTLYAKWTLKPYTVTYNANGATGGSVPIDVSTYTMGSYMPISGNTGSLVRTGYSFIGWGTSSTDSGNPYVSGDSFLVGTSNIGLWARWSANTYTVTFDVNGASGAPSKTSDTYTTAGNAIVLATVGTMSKTGYNFAGWGLSSVSSVLSDGLTVSSNTKLYAQWTLASFSVTYLVGTYGGGTPPTQVAVNFGSRFTVAEATGLTGSDGTNPYAFVSWSDGSTTYAPGQSYLMSSSPVSLTAQWTRVYNVKYSFNGGTVASAIADLQKVSGDSIIVSSVVPTRDGYTFTGWKDQSGDAANAGSNYTVRPDHYLFYAQWTAIAFTITYDVNGGNTSPVEANHTIGQIFSVAAAPTKTGYDFAYWSDGTNRFNAGSSYQVGANNIVLQAIWTPQVYQISFNFNNGVGTAISPLNYTFNTGPANLPASGPTRQDFNFVGWATTTTATTPVSSSFAPSGNILLHAVWVSSVHRINFNVGLGFSDSSTATVTIGQAIILPTASRTNYTLQGWSTTPTGTSVGQAGSSYTPTVDGTLYALWALQVFNVNYNGNGGSAARNSDSMSYGSQTPIVLPSASRQSYVFNGWYSAEAGGYLLGLAGANYSPTSSLTAYARWIQGSLSGMGPATLIAQVTVHDGLDTSFTAGSNGSTATVSYTAGALPDGSVIITYLENSTTRVASLLSTPASPILSMIVAWVAPNGLVPDTAAGKPIVMTVVNPSITVGSRVYGLIGNQPELLGMAVIDGQVQVSISKDPVVVIAIVTPEAPTAVTAVANGETSATISWTAPVNNGGAVVSEYTASTVGKSCTSTTTTCVIKGLSTGTAYTFTVIAKNAIGNSAASSPSASLTLSAPTSGNNAGGSGGGGGGGNVYVPPSTNTSNAAESSSTSSAEAKATAEKAASDAKVAAELKAAQEKATAEAAEVAALKAALEIADAQARVAAELKAAQEKAAEIERIASELKAAQEKADAELKAAAEKKALDDAAAAAALAAKKIAPKITLYSISSKLTLSAYDNAYLKKYISTLKSKAIVTCIGYYYSKNTTLVKAKALATLQAKAICTMIKKVKPTVIAKIAIYPPTQAPRAAKGAQWVAVSYRVDSFKN